MKKKEGWYFERLVILAIAIALVASVAITAYATDEEGMTRTAKGMKRTTQVVERSPVETQPIHNPAGSKMFVAQLTIVPTCDGYIDPTEWSDAYMYDISDTTGQHDGVPDPLGTVYLWLKQDDIGVYFAVRNNADLTLDDFDNVGLYFDDDHDGCFPASATTEGNHWVEYHPTGNLVNWRWIQDTDCGFPPDYVCSGDNFGAVYPWSPTCFGIGIGPTGVVDYEIMIPYGAVDEYLDLTMPPDSLGFFIYCEDNANGDFQGTWPSQGRGDTWKEPCYYGHLICETGEEWPDHKMHWPQLPDLDETGMDVEFPDAPLGDDWMCTQTGPVTDIHIWGSFEDDVLPDGGPGALGFFIFIMSDNPGPPSTPVSILWSKMFNPGSYVVNQVANNNPEDWYDPWTGLWMNNNHLNAYQYDFFIEDSFFVQDSGTVYWLVIATTSGLEYSFGWKTTEFHRRYRDDAVWQYGPIWTPMFYPPGHEYADLTLDLAFVITGPECWPSIDVEKKVWDEANADWVDSTDIDSCSNAEFLITIHNDGTCGDLWDIDVSDYMDSSLEFISAEPPAAIVLPIPGGTLIGWSTFPGPLPPCDSINISVTAHVVGPVCHTDSNYVLIDAYCPAQDTLIWDDDKALVHATGPEWPNHKMHFPQLPDTMGWDVNATYPKTLADDWQCSQTGPVMDIHFWGSWKDLDGDPYNDDPWTSSPSFILSIHENIPASPDTPWSRPGRRLWFWEGPIHGAVSEPPTLEGWFDPNTGEVIYNDHAPYWRYDFFLDQAIPPPEDTFYQYKDSIYWLDICALDIPPPWQWGWKNSRDHFKDAAVYTDNAPYGPWFPIFEPSRQNHFNVYFGPDEIREDRQTSLDLAFVITTEEVPVICGDANNDGVVDIGDVVYIINYLFRQPWPPPQPYMCVGDANNDDVVDIGDVVYIINYLFRQPWPPPDPDCCNPPWKDGR